MAELYDEPSGAVLYHRTIHPMETILQSSEDATGSFAGQVGVPLAEQPRWPEVITILRNNTELHAYTIYYWACIEDQPEDAWKVTPFLRAIVSDNPSVFLV